MNIHELIHLYTNVLPLFLDHTCINTHILYGAYSNLYEYTHPVWGIQQPVRLHTSCMGHTATCMNTHTSCMGHTATCMNTHIRYGAYNLYEYTHPVLYSNLCEYTHTSCMGHTTCMNTHILYGAYSNLCEYTHILYGAYNTATCVNTHILYGAYSHLYEYTHPVRNIQQCKGAMIRRCKLPQAPGIGLHRSSHHRTTWLYNQQASETSQFVTAQTTSYQAVFPLKLLSMLSPVQIK